MEPKKESITFGDRVIRRIARSVERWSARLVTLRNRALIAQLGECGRGVYFYGRVKITAPGQMKVGDNVHISDNAWIRAEGGVTIGDNTHLSRNLVLYSMSHDYNGARLPYDEGFILKPVVIGRNVWIGMNVCIAPGTVIGDGAIVGMGTVVSGTVPPLAVVGSTKWRVLKQRDAEHYERLDAAGQYGGANGRAYDQLKAEVRISKSEMNPNG